MNRWLLALCLLTVAGEVRADDELGTSRQPPPEQRSLHAIDHLKLQSGGYLGLATVGVGLAAFQDHLNVTGYYGWVPEEVGGTSVHSLTLMITGRASRLRLDGVRWVPVYAGAGALYVQGHGGFFLSVPDRYPAGYYPPTGIRAFAVVGSELELSMRPREAPVSPGLFVEVVALDVLVIEWARNSDSVSVLDTLSTAVGYKARWP
jgi:hypothetical protein